MSCSNQHTNTNFIKWCTWCSPTAHLETWGRQQLSHIRTFFINTLISVWNQDKTHTHEQPNQMNLFFVRQFWFIKSFRTRITELNGGQPPLTYKRFQTLISRMDPPEMPVETLSGNLMGRCVTPISEDHGDKFGVPSLEELGEETKHGYRNWTTEEWYHTSHSRKKKTMASEMDCWFQGLTSRGCHQPCGREERQRLWPGLTAI